ncbi:MAG: IS1634 family transposase [Actinomycetota bacterium]
MPMVERRQAGAMHVATIRRRHGEREYVSYLLRQSFREGGKVRHRTLGNLSHLPAEVIDLVRRALRGEPVADVPGGGGTTLGAVEVARSLPHGHVAAVMSGARRRGLPEILGPACRERDLALALIVARVVRPGSKAATCRWWRHTTLGVDCGLERADADDCYAAMDWLLACQGDIEKRLAARHLAEGGLVYYDVSGSYLEGRTCPLGARGYSRDAKRGKLQVVYGLVCDAGGRPVAVRAHPGNAGDPATLAEAVRAVREQFGLSRVVVVGDRGMITQARIDALTAQAGVGWITTLRAPQIAALVAEGAIQMSLFDERGLAEITHPDYPGERLVVCRNPSLLAERARKRGELLAATEKDLARVAAQVAAGRLKDPGKIGLRAGRVLHRHKMAKRFVLDIAPGRFSYARKDDALAAEEALDGIYVVRSSVAEDELDAADLVRAYKDLSHVERAFRSLKSVDLEVRPIHHRLEDRVRAHLLICMLAYYLTWHLRRAWAPITFTDEARPTRKDPVAKAERSPAATRKARRGRTQDGQIAHGFREVLDILATLTRNTLRLPGAAEVEVLATPSPLQARAFELLGATIPARLA